MVECNSNETLNMYPNSNDQRQFRANKISAIKNYFVVEIKERELMGKRVSKDIAFFDYFDKSLIALCLTSGSISLTLFATVIGASVGIASPNFNLSFSFSIGIVKKLLRTVQNKAKKHNKIVMLARSKLNRIESKITIALIYNEISHEDFMTIISKEKNYQGVKKAL